MTDTNKLKELAERATPTGWTHDADRYVVAKSDQVNDGWGICLCEGPDAKKNRDFIAAANPAAVLELIAEVERLREKLGECSVSLHGEMMQKYGGQEPDDMHPVTKRDYDRDMAEILEYQEALLGGGR